MIFFQIIKRDIKIALRNKSSFLNPLLFFIIAISLFPLAISPDAKVLSTIAAGLIWVSVLLSVLLSLNLMFADDSENGLLEQMSISIQPLPLIVLAKITVHFLLTGLPIVLISPLLGVLLFMQGDSILVLMTTLILTTPTLSLIGGIGTSIIANVKNPGILLSLMVLPLYMPVLIFASGAITNFEAGLDITGNLYFLATILVLFLMITPFIGSVAIKTSLE